MRAVRPRAASESAPRPWPPHSRVKVREDRRRIQTSSQSQSIGELRQISENSSCSGCAIFTRNSRQVAKRPALMAYSCHEYVVLAKLGATRQKKKAPETSPFRKPFSQVWRLRESHFRESLSRVSAPFRRADFLCPTEAKNMDPHLSTTPFGRRPLSLAMVASQVAAKARPLDATVHKWQVFRAICRRPRTALGISDRALAVLNALLTFHPRHGSDERATNSSCSRRTRAARACARHAAGDAPPSIWRTSLTAGW